MKKVFLSNLFWINLLVLILPIALLVPSVQGLLESSPYIAMSLLLVIGGSNFLAVMLIVFILNGAYGKWIAISSFVLWVVVASQGVIGFSLSVFVTTGYWVYQRKFIIRYSSEMSGKSEST
ncbi:hypothetical protein MED297_08366 [Reinekea sp. MED297]|uniref:Uncharacterized protein n=1 Tax=Reinekea blandensis MED297 TaxID=314283 RepID=A4BD06_9GAMM|nr:hypothetical protein MED297_08366 [Reinekea sp. MED297] [Reinekea blandensis MED297]